MSSLFSAFAFASLEKDCLPFNDGLRSLLKLLRSLEKVVFIGQALFAEASCDCRTSQGLAEVHGNTLRPSCETPVMREGDEKIRVSCEILIAGRAIIE